MNRNNALLLITLVAAVSSAALLLAACSGGSSESGAPVTITEKDYSISATPSKVAAGKVTFSINNEGPSTHEFVIVKTDTQAAQIPFDKAKSEVNEDDPSLQHIDEAEDIKSGKTKKLTVDLAPGHYAFICNITAHYQQGMHLDFTVE